MTPLPNTAEAIMRRLEDHGIAHVFGIPGTHNLPLYAALAAGGMRHVAPRHEQGAGYAADGYARATGRPAVCLVTTGPGVTNIATAIATAHADSVPMIVIAPGPPADVDGHDTGYLHEARDQFGAIAALSGTAERVRTPAQAIAAIDRAMLGFANGRPRPFYIEIPVDRLDTTGPVSAAVAVTPERTRPDPASIIAACAALQGARSVAMILGGGAVDAGAQAVALAERLQAAVITTVNGKGTVSEEHPLSLGAAARLGVAQEVLTASDVVLAVGTELAESDLWRMPPLPLNGTLVRVDVDPAQVHKNAQADIVVLADAAQALDALLDALPADDRPSRAEWCDAVRTRVTAAADDDGAHFHPLMDLLDAALDDDAIVACDSAQLCYYGAVHYLPARQSRGFLYPTGYATLGYALPAAFGAKVACPDRQVVALVGDGGLLFSVAELGAAVAAGLSLPIIVFNNSGYGEIRDEMLERGMPLTGVDFEPGSLVGMAEAFGAAGVQVDELARFPEALEAALRRPGPTLIELTAATARPR